MRKGVERHLHLRIMASALWEIYRVWKYLQDRLSRSSMVHSQTIFDCGNCLGDIWKAILLRGATCVLEMSKLKTHQQTVKLRESLCEHLLKNPHRNVSANSGVTGRGS